jgi:hypothetical protein
VKRYPTAAVLGLAYAALAAMPAAADATGVAGVPKARPLKIEHHAGQLEPGPQFDYTFPIRNEGTAPLSILRAEADCICISPEFDPVIEPGATGSVRIRFDTKGRVGLMRKNVTVETNDPERPQFVLTLVAMLRLPVEVSPGTEIMLPLAAGEEATTEITLHATQGKTLTLGPIRASHPALRPRVLKRKEVAERVQADLARTQIVLVSIPKSLAGKAFDAVLSIPTNSPKTPVVTVRLHGYPQTAVAATPPRLYFGEAKASGGPRLMRIVALQRREGAFKVLSVESSDPALRLQVSQERANYWEVVALYEGGWPKGIHRGVLTIRTDDPQRPILKVPFSADVS